MTFVLLQLIQPDELVKNVIGVLMFPILTFFVPLAMIRFLIWLSFQSRS